MLPTPGPLELIIILVIALLILGLVEPFDVGAALGEYPRVPKGVVGRPGAVKVDTSPTTPAPCPGGPAGGCRDRPGRGVAEARPAARRGPHRG